MTDAEIRHKKVFTTIAERQRTFENILNCIRSHSSFLLLGHELPDEDCIASLVSMALLLSKCGKKPALYLKEPIPEQLAFLAGICAYNKIPCFTESNWDHDSPDVICVLDTPKPEMIALHPNMSAFFKEAVIPIIEFDHHLSADAAYAGTEGLCMVTRATSTCELISLFCMKISSRRELCEEFSLVDLFSRNLALALLTGIIGDTKFGLTIKNHRDSAFYSFYTKRFGKILKETRYKNSKNYGSMQDIFKTLESLSVEEKDLYQALLDRARFSSMTGYLMLDAEESANFTGRIEYTLFVKVIKSVTDYLSEKSGVYGLTAYYDPPEFSNLVQFRIRTSRDVTDIDLRTILGDFPVAEGGGHPGAIGFRVPASDVTDFTALVCSLIEAIEKLQKDILHAT